MDKNENFQEFTGKMGGLKVKGMIKDIEQKMANGLEVSAAPVNQEEEKHLKYVREANQKSSENANSSSFS